MDERNFFDHPAKHDLKAYDNIQKIATGQGEDYTTDCLLYCPYFKKRYEMILIDLSKQQALDVDQKGTQQIDFTGNLGRAATMHFFI